MLVGGVVGVVVVLGLAAAVFVRRRSHDDEHSVEHYHRQLHTLEEMRAHQESTGGGNGNDDATNPASAFRVSGSSTVRLTEPGRTVVPPAPPPPVPNPAEPVAFDDAGDPGGSGDPGDPGSSEPVPGSFMRVSDDRVMESINHRPRRLGAPLAAIGAVTVLIAVLIVTGLHTNAPPHHPGQSNTATTTSPPHRPAGHHATDTTTTSTAPLTVSAPTAASAHTATYQVAGASYSLALAATTGECWLDVTDTATGAVLFTGTLFSGQSHTVAATSPVTVIAGAPAAFSATVNGSAVTLPPGYQAPFTLAFQTAQAA